jgi:translation elongation factor EF-Ts
MGNFTYTSVGTVQHTVRQFSAKVTTAIRWRYGQEIEEQEKIKTPPSN